MRNILFNTVIAAMFAAGLTAYTFKWQKVKADIYTAEDCVTDMWLQYETRTGRMPTVEDESQWRDECWEALSGEVSE